MPGLRGRDRPVVIRRIRNIFGQAELDPEATCAKFAQVQFRGARAVPRKVNHSLNVSQKLCKFTFRHVFITTRRARHEERPRQP